MLVLIVGSDIDSRKKALAKYLTTEFLTVDDTNHTFDELEKYVFPSLFSTEPALIHGKFLLGGVVPTVEKINKLFTSPTMFVLEEVSITTEQKKLFEKNKVEIVVENSKKKEIKNTLFDVANIFTIKSKKDRWMYFSKIKEEHVMESLMGIFYWKLKTLSNTTNLEQKKYFKNVYKKLITAHKTSWQKGIPLSILVEKVILEM